MKEHVSTVRVRYRGRLLQLDEVEVVLPDGRKAIREVVRHPGAAVVLARHPDGRFAFVRQHRIAAGQDLLETVAGGLDPAEAPATCAARELREETGYAATRLVPLGTIYPAPGYTSEVMHLFFAELDPVPAPLDPDEDENLSVEWLTPADIDHRIATGELKDAKTIAIWHLYGARRP